MAQEGSPATVPAQDRIAGLDLVRGVAVMGILFANIAAFGQPMSATFYPGAFLTPAAAGDEWLWLAQLVLIDGKMRGLFTLLFGAGLILFIERAWARSQGAGLQLRRLGWLLLFGVAHYVLLWRGDILTAYALGGAVALLLVRWSARRLLIFGLVAYAVGALISTGLYGFMSIAANPAAAADPQLAEMHGELAVGVHEALQEDFAHGELIAAGDYGAFVSSNLQELPGFVGFTFTLLLLETVPLIALGMAAYKLGFFSGALPRRKLFWWSVAGLTVGATITLLGGAWELERSLTYWSSLSAFGGWSMWPRLPMILGLAGLLVLSNDWAQGWLGDGLRAAGRAAFTNYLGTSFIMLWLFHGFGFDLFGELGRAELYAVALGTILLMPLWSYWWLARYRYGPLEWLWRCLTYGRKFPFKRSHESSQAHSSIA